VLVAVGHPLFGTWIMTNAAWATAEGNMAIPGNKASFHTPTILEGVVDVTIINTHNCGVVVEVVSAPLAAGKANAAVAEAVVHAAVVADVRSPVAIMEDIKAIGPSPITGCP
jgi:phage-related baseplate assembly protein